MVPNLLAWIVGFAVLVAVLYYASWLVVLALVVGLSIWLWRMKTARVETFDELPVPSPAYYDGKATAVSPPMADTKTACPAPRSAESCCGISAPLRIVDTPVCYPPA